MDNEKQHIRHIMLYEFRKGKTVGAATKDIRKVYLDHAPGLHQPRSGWPSELDDDVLRTLVVNNSRISTEEVASELNINKSTAFRRLKKIGGPYDNSNFFASTDQKRTFLDRLVTGDEKWILYNNVQRKRTWKQAHEGSEPVAKGGLHPMKVLLCIWWDIRGVIYFELLPAGETITADKYCQQLVELKKAIEEKRPILSNRKGVLFHHDNARSHVAKPTLAKLKEMNWEIMPHPPYSPDIAPSDYHLFRSLQNNLNGKKFKNVEDVKNHLDTFFNEKPRNFYESGIRKLVERWEWIAEHDGKYIID
ncbi:histone-lysine N-methyltransferase SETMAR-like [Phlebotomus papatasi]|uniref:histone-lysine N-methyltransferase SETMAR-like n=1 Tax=Phlebotomus papatasi TaxID=29031 RepID=UPI002483EF2E|nr:histone-lysine N-methyltransferase SETMAR-like [Phlebotomus papatasi]